MYQNPKQTKHEIRFFFFYLMDGIIFAVTMMVGNSLIQPFNIPPQLEIFSYVLFGLLGIFLCLRTSRHPVDRKLNMIIHLFRSNQNKYHDIETVRFESITSEKEDDE